MTTERILIVGAGIAGLTLAQALKRRSIPFDIIEHVEKPAPVGAGIMINFNALRLLDALGFKNELRQRGQTFSHVLIGTKEGRTLQQADASKIIPGVEVLGIHRADLHDILSHGVEVHWGTTFTHWKAAQNGMAVTLNNGKEREYTLVIGADGLNSSVRKQVLPDIQPKYAGYTCWRFITPYPFADPVEWWGPGQRLGLVNIGQGQCYGYATQNAPAGQLDPPAGRAARVRELFAGYPAPADDILHQLRDKDVIHHDLYELPRHRWYSGRVALLGDAAHAMTPNLGQGAGMGIEDAIVLAEALRVYGLTSIALETYAAARQTRVKTIADASRSIGLLGQLEHPTLRHWRDAVLSNIPQGVTNAQSKTQLFDGAPNPPRY